MKLKSGHRPLIGITCHFNEASWGGWTAEAVITHAQYAHVVRRAGGRVVFIPPDVDANDIADRLDALIISGGLDVGPKNYGQEAHAKVSTPDIERDESELSLIRHAWELDLPVLGICRGLQVMAVGSGGTLVQHLPDITDLTHMKKEGYFVRHQAAITGDSLAGQILGVGEIEVNSSHHQAVLDPGSLVITGHAEDGTIEVCEDPSRTFWIGVQWHPEFEDSTTGAPLFSALINAASVYADKRN
jgi:putative glutamine amidotransferase